MHYFDRNIIILSSMNCSHLTFLFCRLVLNWLPLYLTIGSWLLSSASIWNCVTFRAYEFSLCLAWKICSDESFEIDW